MKEKKTLTIRPGKGNKGMVTALELLAKLDGRTLNNYVVRLLDTHIKKFEPKREKVK